MLKPTAALDWLIVEQPEVERRDYSSLWVRPGFDLTWFGVEFLDLASVRHFSTDAFKNPCVLFSSVPCLGEPFTFSSFFRISSLFSFSLLTVSSSYLIRSSLISISRSSLYRSASMLAVSACNSSRTSVLAKSCSWSKRRCFNYYRNVVIVAWSCSVCSW